MRHLALGLIVACALTAPAVAATSVSKKVATSKTTVIHEVRTNPNLARGHDIEANTISRVSCRRIVKARGRKAKRWQCAATFTTTYTPAQHCSAVWRLGYEKRVLDGQVISRGWNERTVSTTCPTRGSSEEG